MVGGILKICLSSGCSYMMCHFFNRTSLMFVSWCDKRAKYLLFLHDELHATLKLWTPADVLRFNRGTSAGVLDFVARS